MFSSALAHCNMCFDSWSKQTGLYVEMFWFLGQIHWWSSLSEPPGSTPSSPGRNTGLFLKLRNRMRPKAAKRAALVRKKASKSKPDKDEVVVWARTKSVDEILVSSRDTDPKFFSRLCEIHIKDCNIWTILYSTCTKMSWSSWWFWLRSLILISITLLVSQIILLSEPSINSTQVLSSPMFLFCRCPPYFVIYMKKWIVLCTIMIRDNVLHSDMQFS